MSNTTDKYEALIKQLTELELEHKQEIFDIIGRQTEERNDIILRIDAETRPTHLKARTTVASVVRKQVRPNSKYTDKKGSPLAIGDIITLLTTARVGKIGDRARVEEFSGRYVHISLLIDVNLTTKRYSTNLELFDSES